MIGARHAGAPLSDFSPDGVTLLGTLGGTNSYAYAINRSGPIAGAADLPGDAGSHAFLTQGGAVAGSACLAGDLIARAFVYANGKMLDSGALDATHSDAYDLNDAGEAVGALESVNADHSVDRRAFLYSGGRMVSLNSLVDPGAGWTLQCASAINDKALISAYACTTGWDCQDVLPSLNAGDEPAGVPEPAAFTAGLAGLALAGLMRRRSRLTSPRLRPPAAGTD